MAAAGKLRSEHLPEEPVGLAEEAEGRCLEHLPEEPVGLAEEAQSLEHLPEVPVGLAEEDRLQEVFDNYLEAEDSSLAVELRHKLPVELFSYARYGLSG